MKKWGLVVTLFYGLLVLVFLVPAALFLVSSSRPNVADLKEIYTSGIPWICAGIVMLGEGLLLWLSVDTTQKRLKPRTPVLVCAIATGLLLSILTVAFVLALGLGVRGDKFLDLLPNSPSVTALLSAFAIPWLVWGVLFYRLCRNSSDPVTRAVAWLFRGSALELLIAVPAHVVARRRQDCCAPVITGYGITSGIVIMLLSFGPSVLLLYKKRMERYATKGSEKKQ